MPRSASLPLRTASVASGREIGLSGDRGRALRVIPGGRNRPTVAFVPQAELDELHLELVTARAERLVYTAKVRELVRSAERHMAAGHVGVTAMHLESLAKLNEQEARRAATMAAPECACGADGAGHGPMDEAAMALPTGRAA